MRDSRTTRLAARRHASLRRGAVLILVMIVLSALSLLALGLTHRVRLELKMARARGRQLQAYYLALGGVNRALAAISEDQDPAVDHLGEPWHINNTAAGEGFLTTGDNQDDFLTRFANSWELSYATSDEAGRLNLNSSSTAGWMKLPGMNEPLARAILDWEDADDSPGAGGAESAEYQRGQPPHAAKNLPIRMPWELTLIKGTDWSSVNGEDINGNGTLESNENDGPKTWPMDDSDGEIDHGLADFFTSFGKGKINLNTAGSEVLSAIPEMDLASVDALCGRRAGPDGQEGTSDDEPFRSLDELTDVLALSAPQIAILQSNGTIQSEFFRITATAAPSDWSRGCRLQAVVGRDDKGLHMILLRRD